MITLERNAAGEGAVAGRRLGGEGEGGISVIICAHNSAARLGPTLAALKGQSTPREGWELVVVDNASTDATAHVCSESWVGEKVPLSIVREDRPGQARARQAGIRNARRKYLCFVDDDNHLCPGYLARAEEIMDRHPDVAVLGGCGVAAFDGEKPSWLWNGWQSHAVGPQGRSEGYVGDERGYVYGAGAVIRRSALRELGHAGFVSELTGRSAGALGSGDDIELCFALRVLGWRIYQSPELRFGHYMPASRLTWEYCLRLFSAYGEANAVLDLYAPWTAAGPRAAAKRTLPGLLWHEVMELRRIKRRLDSLAEGEMGDFDVLSRMEAAGKRDAILRNLFSGRLLSIHRNLRRLFRHARNAARQQYPMEEFVKTGAVEGVACK